MKDGKILAMVGERQITENDVDMLLKSLDPETAKHFNSAEGRQTLVGELINQELFYLDAIDKGYDKEEAYLSEIEIMKTSLLKKYALDKLLGSLSVDNSEIESFYFQNKDLFKIPVSIRASHILVDVAEEAQNILEEINDGLSFEEAARKYSVCPSKDEGGDLGYFAKGRMVPEFEKAAFEAKENQVVGPVETPFGFHLIKVVDTKKSEIRPLSEVRNQIVQEMMARKQEHLFGMKVTELKKKYSVKTNL